MPSTSVTGQYQYTRTPNTKVIVLCDNLIDVSPELARTADYVMSRDGAILKSRDGSEPPLIFPPKKESTCKAKHRSIDDQ